VELPSGYDHVYASPGGQYILSDNANFVPDPGWRELQKMK
jgi:hypothetical protein